MLIFLITLVYAATHQEDFPRFLLGFELLLGICLFLDVRRRRRHIMARLRMPEICGSKREDFCIEAELTNASRFPLSEIRVEVGYQDLYSGKREKVWGTAILDGESTVRLRFFMNSEYCGAIAFWLSRVTISDYLGVFKARCRLSEGTFIFSVLPEGKKEIPEVEALAQHMVAEGEASSLNQAGDDPSETYDIRPYREGDTMHRIHWKMTAKMDQLLVRDFSQPAEDTTLVLLDLRKTEHKLLREDWDHFLEVTASLSRKLLQVGCIHYVAWMDVEAAGLCRIRVGEEEEWQGMLSALLRGTVYEDGDIEVYYKENYGEETLGEIIRIDLRGQICRTQAGNN